MKARIRKIWLWLCCAFGRHDEISTVTSHYAGGVMARVKYCICVRCNQRRRDDSGSDFVCLTGGR